MGPSMGLFSVASLIAISLVLTKANEVDMDALGLGADYFNEGDRAAAFNGGENFDSFEEPSSGLAHIDSGFSFGQPSGSMPTMEAGISRRGRTKEFRKNLSDRKKLKQEKAREERLKEKERRKQEWAVKRKQYENTKKGITPKPLSDDGSE